ncbi:MAG: large conductance mechanosensitive channel protein MscL [Pseudomonadota bacterium]|jgi:large conductance mechanosensitive channel
MTTMMKDFKDFALKGSVFDLAIGVIVGAAFGKIVDSLVKDIIMPLIGKLIGNLDFSNMFIIFGSIPNDFKGSTTSYTDLVKAGVSVFAYGNFITIILNFLILAFIVFQMVRIYSKLKKSQPVPVEITAEEIVLLREIRDSLKK